MDINDIKDKGEVAILIVREERVLQQAQQNLQLLHQRFNQLDAEIEAETPKK